ncbi:MAG: peroxidase family protein [Bacteroidota bacterium]
MAQRLLLCGLLLSLAALSHAQTLDTDLYRTIDGRFNNPNQPTLGMAHTALLRVSGNGFADGQSAPAGPDRPNPRAISNALFAQDGLLNDPVGLSDFTWVFGQFMDHDLGLTEHPGEDFSIPVPMGDPQFDPMFFGTVRIPLTRNAPRFGTGSGVGNPRQYDNELTAFIDGSAVYGSDDTRAAWLRSFADGKLKVSAGNLLPYNTLDGEIGSPVDPRAPHMADAVGRATRLFVAGDIRANENPLLATFHTLFVREHNRQCDLLKNAHPDWDDEQLYQHARKIVGGLIQSITYDEWLPAMGVDIPEYTGYSPTVNPQLSNVFTAAAFRVGHTLLNANIRRLGPDGAVLADGNMTLREAFFNVDAVRETGLDPFLRGMAEQVQQKMDNRIVDDVRNFLFGPPGAGGLDLAAINIARGRDRGLPSYNRIRQSYGLPVNFDFFQINPDPEVYQALAGVYENNINEIDPWVAMLAERPMDGSIFGQTIQRIMSDQFRALRDGDRFYYENDPVLSDAEKDWIRTMTFRDVVMYNSGISLMQDNVFEAMPFSDICGSMTVAVDGVIKVHTTEEPLPAVSVNVLDGDGLVTTTNQTTELGFYDFDALQACHSTVIQPARDDDWRAGINIFDLVAIQRDLLGIESLANPYQYLAADANADGTIDVFDIVALSRIILELDTELQPAPASPWNFVAADYVFEDPEWPFNDANIPSVLNFADLDPTQTNQGFVAYKRGDVNADANLLPDNLAPGIFVDFPEINLQAGETQRIALTLSGEELAGFQLSLFGNNAEILQVVSTDLVAYNLHDGQLDLVQAEAGLVRHTLTLDVRASTAGSLSDLLGLSPDYPALAVDLAGEAHPIQLGAAAGANTAFKSEVFPNPFTSDLTVNFVTPLLTAAQAQLLDVTGRTVLTRQLAVGTEQAWFFGEQLPQGTYLLRVIGDGGQILTKQKLVKN